VVARINRLAHDGEVRAFLSHEVLVGGKPHHDETTIADTTKAIRPSCIGLGERFYLKWQRPPSPLTGT
jgi:hypothetical protein